MTAYDCQFSRIDELRNMLSQLGHAFSADKPPTLYDPVAYGDLTAHKAREILHDGTVHGHAITDKQRRYFGAVASGHAKYSDDRRHRGTQDGRLSYQATPVRYADNERRNPQAPKERAPDASWQHLLAQIERMRASPPPAYEPPMRHSYAQYDATGRDDYAPPGLWPYHLPSRGPYESPQEVGKDLQSQYAGHQMIDPNEARRRLYELARAGLSGSIQHTLAEVQALEDVIGEREAERIRQRAWADSDSGRLRPRATDDSLYSAYGSVPYAFSGTDGYGHLSGAMVPLTTDEWRNGHFGHEPHAYGFVPYDDDEPLDDDEEQYAPEDLDRMRGHQDAFDRDVQWRRDQQQHDQDALDERRRQRDQNRPFGYAQYGLLGSIGGGVAGGMLGAAAGGPIGGFAGSATGGYLGDHAQDEMHPSSRYAFDERDANAPMWQLDAGTGRVNPHPFAGYRPRVINPYFERAEAGRPGQTQGYWHNDVDAGHLGLDWTSGPTEASRYGYALNYADELDAVRRQIVQHPVAQRIGFGRKHVAQLPREGVLELARRLGIQHQPQSIRVERGAPAGGRMATPEEIEQIRAAEEVGMTYPTQQHSAPGAFPWLQQQHQPPVVPAHQQATGIGWTPTTERDLGMSDEELGHALPSGSASRTHGPIPRANAHPNIGGQRTFQYEPGLLPPDSNLPFGEEIPDEEIPPMRGSRYAQYAAYYGMPEYWTEENNPTYGDHWNRDDDYGPDFGQPYPPEYAYCGYSFYQ